MNPESKNTMKHDEMLGGSSDVIFRKVNSRSRSKRGDTVMVSEEIESWEDATDASIGKEGLVGTIRCGWSTLEPLAHRVSSRDIVRSGLTLQSKVSDIVVNGTWLWPVDMLSKYPFLSNYNTPINDDVDRLVWSDSMSSPRTTRCVIEKLVVAASAYYVNWIVAFGGNPKKGKLLGKCKTRTVPRKDNMYSVDLKNVVPQGGLTCLFAKATPDEANIWHRRLGHVNFKTMNKLYNSGGRVGMVVKAAVVRRSWRAWRCGDDDGGARVAVAVASWWRLW
ncbi:ribonuclease H-like domain-containing protein [Tanacetum coccineum]